MKQPDRWERIVHSKTDMTKDMDPFMHGPDVIKLLRQEHAWVRRMINAHNRSIQGFTDHDLDPQWKKGYAQACMEILNKLKERSK